MTRIPFLLAFFVLISPPANGQTDPSPPRDDRGIQAEPSLCETTEGGSATPAGDCPRLPPDLETLFIKERIKRDPPPAIRIEGGDKAEILPQLVLPPVGTVGPGKKGAARGKEYPGFRWGPALRQYFLLLAIEHAFDLTQEKTRRELKGPFVKDYFRSVRGLGGWSDGGKFFTNYVAHPMGGSAHGWIYVQNDLKGLRQEFGRSKDYWVSRLKAMAWSAACSAQFELGPLSQAAIGNVGLHTPHSGKGKRKMAYVDLVITPTVGTAWMMGEDMAERYILRPMHDSDYVILKHALRVLLTPTRSAANLLRFKMPWYRDE
ncbi:MAG TPA: hypothetical protein VE262_23255 [Blastocatellia bacterium]|nr:hypothetical protein [Blastocatellia bacterium]